MIPQRLNLVDVEIKLLLRKDRVTGRNRPAMDPVYKRPKGRENWDGPDTGNILNLRAQVYFERQEDEVETNIGDSPQTAAHLTMRRSDFDDLSIKPQKGDLITKIAGDVVNNYAITEVRNAGFLKNKARLVMIFFDRPKELLGMP